MDQTRAKRNVAGTAYLTAWARALGRRIAGDAANGDQLAERVLLPSQRALAVFPRLAVWLLERGLPGAVGTSMPERSTSTLSCDARSSVALRKS